jgi:galactose mutarotase-like enzyme
MARWLATSAILATDQGERAMTAASQILRLYSGSTEVTIAPHRGTIVTSFRVAQRELLYLDEVTFNDHSKNVRGGIPVLFPSPGKLENDRWTQAGKSGELKQHGFARNLSWQLVAQSATDATLSLASSAETLRGFPWAFQSKLTYTVSPNALRIDFRVTNHGDSPMPLAFGLHPYFRVHDKTRARIPTHATRAFDNVLKRVVPFTSFDLTQSEVDLHLLDHGSTRGVLELDDETRIAIETSPQFVRWIVWTVAGKEYVCLEPWTASGNALNTGEDLIFVQPGGECALWTRMAVENRSRS